MFRFGLGLIVLTMLQLAAAAEVVAWKVPLSGFADGDMTLKQWVRIEPPESSPFFHAGDELWDLTKIPATERRVGELPLEWAVWNATTDTLVTKSDWNTIWRLYQLLRIEETPRQSRVKLEAFEVPTDGAPLSDKVKPVATMVLVARSGENAEVSSSNKHGTLRAKITPHLSDDGGEWIDLRIDATCAMANQAALEVKTGLTLKSGDALWLARDFDGKRGIDLKLSAAIESMDGLPLADLVQLDQGGKIIRLSDMRREFSNQRVGDEGWLTAKRVPRGLDLGFFATAGNPEPDPFSETGQEAAQRKAEKFPLAQPPSEIAAWFPHAVWDLRKVLEATGIKLDDPRDFAGYDPLLESVFLFSTSESAHDLLEQIFAPGCNLTPKNIIVTLDGHGQSRIVMRTGERATVARPSTKGQSLHRQFEAESTISEGEDIVDLKLRFDDRTKPDAALRFDSSRTLRVNKPTELLSVEQGSEPPLRLRATVELFSLRRAGE